MTAPIWSEADRVRALRSYDILNTAEEREFDDIVKLAAEICGVPISLISLLETDRQWFKAKTGLNADSTPIEQSICAHAILQNDVFVVPDTTQDPRFNCNPLVTGEPNLRFYAGAVLETEDHLPIGMLCVLDYKPRTLTEQQGKMLKALARQVMTQLELRRALKLKQQSDDRLQLAFNASEFAGTWNWNLTANVIKSDAHFARTFGIDPDAAQKGVPTSEFTQNIHPEDMARIIPSIERVVSQGGRYAEDYRLLQKNGTVRWMSSRGRADLDEQGKPTSFNGVTIDITDRKKTELKLRESERQFRQLADSIPQLAWMADETGAVFWYNQRWYDYTGTTFEEMQGWDWTKVHDPVELQRMMITWKASLASGEPWQDTFPLRKHTGEMRWHLAQALPIKDDEGRVVRWFGTNTDITEQREAQNAAEAANIAKTEFLANMSHEIRTPMNAVIGLSNILAISQPLTPKQKEYIKTLQMSADSLLALINDLLDIAKIEARSVELERVPFSVVQLVQETISMMNVRAQEKSLHFFLEQKKGGHESPTLIGDPTRLRQIVMNLCSNALKFTEKGSVSIHISCEPITGSRNEMVKIAVKDSGIGIAPEKLETIFQKFIQADSSINRKYGGTGLGLAITKTLAEIMGGTIEVQSALGQGSVFTLMLPLQRATGEEMEMFKTTAETSEPVNATPAQFRPRILIVEDYAPNVLVVSTFLEQFGYEYEIAVNGHEALEKVKNGEYVAVLMDVQMHGMNGLEATRQIREFEKHYNKPRVYIIGMTAHALSGDRERCLSAGMDDYISKPFNPEELKIKLIDPILDF